MRKRIVSSSCAAAVLSLAVAATAQTNTQTPTQSPVQSNQQGTRAQAPALSGASAAQQITIVGCVQREGDSPSTGITARSGAGATSSTSSEFILANAAPAAGSAPGNVAGSTSSGRTATGTSGSGNAGVTGNVGASTSAPSSPTIGSSPTSYSLSGDKERDLAKYVGQRVEIVAMTMPASGTAGAAASGSVGAGAPTRTPEATSTRTPGATASDSTPDTNTRPEPAGTRGVGQNATGSASAPVGVTAHPSAMQHVQIVSVRPLGTNCQ